jgi:tRNA pseudouridine55 synthase
VSVARPIEGFRRNDQLVSAQVGCYVNKENQPLDGILNINKAPDMTSHDVVARIRRLIKQKRVGHAGTLDPSATGVLPICIGQGTRVAEYLSESGKAYQAVITFGIVTDTYDSEGSVLRTQDTNDLQLDQIVAALPSFLGQQMQLPPSYSAIKLQGQPAYKRARAGEALTLQPRPIEIQELQMLDWQPPQLTLAITCSKGTYIRSLAYDLGEHTGYGAHLSSLVRTRSGPFVLAESITLEQLAEAVEQGTWSSYVYSPDIALAQYPAIQLDAATGARVQHGNTFHYNLSATANLARVYDSAGGFLAIATRDQQQNIWQPIKVFIAE